jgi:hypothetical protein
MLVSRPAGPVLQACEFQISEPLACRIESRLMIHCHFWRWANLGVPSCTQSYTNIGRVNSPISSTFQGFQSRYRVFILPGGRSSTTDDIALCSATSHVSPSPLSRFRRYRSTPKRGFLFDSMLYCSGEDLLKGGLTAAASVPRLTKRACLVMRALQRSATEMTDGLI